MVRALRRAGYGRFTQEGSHQTLRHRDTGRKVTVPMHAGRDLKPGIVRSILRQVGLSAEEFRGLLR
jgi:predicted RNA binding protein YcfA (HicA-like mRNA interferase family)